MNKLTITMLSAAAFTTTAFAQVPNYLLTYSQPENTASGSGGTVLGNLLPNEISMVGFAPPCATLSAEKWMPRTNSHVMAGDEDGDGVYFQPNIFGNIDALISPRSSVTPSASENQRTIYYSPAVAMGTTISGAPGLRPGDVGRIARVGALEGQIEYFITQEQLNNALGLPLAYPINIDAITFQPNYGVFLSIDTDVLATTMCGPTLIRDGDIICLPPWTLGYTSALTIATTGANSAVVAYTEAQMDIITANAGVADRFGACVTTVGDVEALDMDLFSPPTTVVPCPGLTLLVPNLVYASENGTGASLLETNFGGIIHATGCGLAGTPCATGAPTMGPQMGIRPASLLIGAPSHVNALASSRACTHVLEPQQHVMPVFPLGAPLGANMIDYNNPFVLSLILIEIVPPTVPNSVPAFPFSPSCFPDLYTPTITPWLPVGPGFGSFPMVGIPPAWAGKVLYQGVGFGSGTFELSTPTVIDVL